MNIRKATLKDLKRIQELNLMLFKKEHEEYDKLLDLDWTFGEVGTKALKENIAGEDSCTFVAENEEIIGYLSCGIKTDAEDYRKLPKMAELDSMFILKEHRKKGIGKQLYEAFIKWAKEKDAKIIRVEASAGNEEGIEFYKKMGLKDYTLILEGRLEEN
jgi:GNAT superfamily N-acetyltransferase